jgi:hypothetical protein
MRAEVAPSYGPREPRQKSKQHGETINFQKDEGGVAKYAVIAALL